ncbi:helix-turn-helix domain-containing protein [Streptomyces sp. NPDC093085]|uniref:AraC-like ligand-binding domain-containing protein n=1 Tax=Streptomyces sp. NPDC093085 TaxID=3155068 RepID=UPI00342B92DE
MIETLFRAEDHPAPERFERWREMACASHAPTRISSEHAEDFRGNLQAVGLGPVTVTVAGCTSLVSDRTPKMVRHSDPEQYNLSYTRSGQAGAVQSGREADLPAGSLVLTSTSHPLHGRMGPDGDGTTTMVQALFPRAMLRLPAGQGDSLLAVALPGRSGIGGLLSRFLVGLTTDPTRYGPADAARIGGVTIDLVSALLGHHLGAETPPEAAPDVLLLKVRAYIHRHLGDPDLTPARIAAAHHISTRTLHRLFHGQDTTVSGWIRRQRLDRARRDLADPSLRARPIHAIATTWGFTHAADFTRAFRTGHGMPPSEYRHRALPVGD